jgi:hypothetical protein
LHMHSRFLLPLDVGKNSQTPSATGVFRKPSLGTTFSDQGIYTENITHFITRYVPWVTPWH